MSRFESICTKIRVPSKEIRFGGLALEGLKDNDYTFMCLDSQPDKPGVLSLGAYLPEGAAAVITRLGGCYFTANLNPTDLNAALRLHL